MNKKKTIYVKYPILLIIKKNPILLSIRLRSVGSKNLINNNILFKITIKIHF